MTETKIQSRKTGVMGGTSIVLGVAGIVLNYLFMFLFLGAILVAETAAARECRLVAPFFLPAFACVGIVGGVLWLVAGMGWFDKKEWAYSVSIVAVIINLFANFWPNIPTMESRTMIPGPWFLLFFPNIFVFFYLVRKRGQESWSKSLLGLLIGMAFILSFINGIAATTRTVNRLPDYTGPDGALMYMLCLPTNMIASFLFGAGVLGLYLSKNKELVRVAVLGGVFLSISAGYPLAIYSMFTGVASGFSMFMLGPITATVVGAVTLPLKVWEKLIV